MSKNFCKGALLSALMGFILFSLIYQMINFLQKIIYDKDRSFFGFFIKVFLWPISILYSFLVKIILFLYKKRWLKVKTIYKPVISVGNITVGGVGKTPLVIYIANLLKENGCRPVILTRGYMPRYAKANFSDEVKMLKEELKDIPIVIGKDRYASAMNYLDLNNHEEVDVFILDDGFQQWGLYKDLEIVAIDAKNPWGNNCLLPSGILREPLSSLKRADFIVLTKTNKSNSDNKLIDHISKYYRKMNSIIKTEHKISNLVDIKTRDILDIDHLKGKVVCAFCSIGDAKYFFDTLLKIGINVKETFAFSDHHVYNTRDFVKIKNACQDKGIDILITTMKDRVKIDQDKLDLLERQKIFCLNIKINITHCKSEFNNGIFSIL